MGHDPQDNDAGERVRSDRRLLLFLIGLLSAVAIGLIILLLFLLKPVDRTALPETGECPIQYREAIYGFGSELDELLLRPLGVTFDPEGNLWVSDTGNSRVLAFGPDGGLKRIVGWGGTGSLASPYGLAFHGSERRLYVADWILSAINVYAADGSYVERIPAADQDPSVFGPDGFTPYEVRLWNGLIVASSNDGLYFFDRSGHVIDRWGGEARGSDQDDFAYPNAFAIDPTTNVFYIADTLNRRIVARDSNGDLLWISGERDVAGQIVGFWQLPRSVTIGIDGNIYVVDTFRAQPECGGEGHIVVLSPNGELLSEFGSAGSDEASFSFPEKLDITPGGRFAVADREHNRVVLFEVGYLAPPTQEELSRYVDSFVRYGD